MADQALTDLQDEVKVLKNEIKDTLIGIRDYLLTNVENPFITGARQQAMPPAAPAPPPQPQQYDASASGGRGSNGPGGGDGGGGVTIVSNFGPAGGQPQPPVDTAPAPEPAALAQAPNAGQQAPAGPPPPQPASTPLASPESDPGAPPPSYPPRRGLNESPQSPELDTAPTPKVPSDAAAAVEPEAEAAAPAKREDKEPGDVTDLLTIATLASWIEDGISRLGPKRLQLLVDIYAAMDGISPRLRDILVQLIDLDSGTEPAGHVALRECVRVLVELDTIMWRSRVNSTGSALLTALVGTGIARGENGKGSGGNGLASLLAL